MRAEPILVIGATGKSGARIVDRLEARGLAVRRGLRRAPIPFDWQAPETWSAALQGVGAVYVTYFPDLAVPGALADLTDFTTVAQAAGVRRLVLLSGRGEHHARQGEDIVRNAGIDFTIVRAAWFAQNFSEGQLRAPILAGILPMPGGAIREPIVDVDDIADVAVAALTEDRHSGALYEVTGPRLLTFAEMADVLSAATGRAIRHQSISFEEFHAGLSSSAGTAMADIITAIARETFDGRNARLADGIERALGRQPTDFAAFAVRAARAGAWTAAA